VMAAVYVAWLVSTEKPAFLFARFGRGSHRLSTSCLFDVLANSERLLGRSAAMVVPPESDEHSRHLDMEHGLRGC